MRVPSACFAVALCLAGASAFAEAPPKAEDVKPAGAKARKDPRGVTGVSPLWEKLAKGDAALVAKDFDGALAAYREAVAASPENALGHYRLGQAQALKGDLKEAESAYSAALRFSGSDAELKAKALFCLADLRERQRASDEAIQRWTEYEAHAKSSPKAKTFPASAAERKKRNQDWKTLSAEAAEVKARIDARLKEAEAAARKSAK